MPYCSPACQRCDWLERHRNTCHNLKRQSAGVPARLEIEPETPTAPPLRRPRSPDARPRDGGPRDGGPRDGGPRDGGPRDAGSRNAGPRDAGPKDAGSRDGGPRDAGSRDAGPRDAGCDRFPPRKFGPPGIATTPTPAARSYNNSRSAGGHTKAGQDADKGPSDRAQADRGRFNRSSDDDNRPNARSYDQNSKYGRKNEERPDRPRTHDGGNRSYGQSRPKQDEDWGTKPSEKPAEAKPAPKPSPVPKEQSFSPKVPPAAEAASPARPMASVADVAPVAARKPSASGQTKPAPAQTKPALVPKNCVIDTLALKDTFMLTAETAAEGAGFICVTLHVDHSDNYERLLDPLSQACEASEACQPQPGDTFAYLDPTDGGWYRARCLTPTRAALLDAARVAALAATDQCRRLHADYAVIPEFCCQLESDKVQLKDQVQCTLVSKSGSDLSVSITSLETGGALGFGTVRRWLPAVEWPQEVAAPTASCARPEAPRTEPASSSAPAVRAAAPASPPTVPRPAVTAGTVYLLVDATEPARLFVRPADVQLQAEFNDVLCEVALYGADEATPRLTELPTAGQTVVARYTDGNHYRALVQRVSSKNRRCLLEYIEYGNAAIVEDLQSLCPCPPQLEPSARPTLTSAVALHMKQKTFSAAATAYLDKLKDDEAELTLTIPSGEQSVPSNTPVRLTVVKSGEEVNRTVDTLSTPDWQKLMERGGDVLETETLFFQQITYAELPGAARELDVFDSSLLKHGILNGHARAADHAKRAHALTAQLNEYCSSALAKDPYTPKHEELCIAMCPTRKQWLRAVMLEQIGGPGGAEANILFYDYGHMAELKVSSLRKMMPEFARDIPAAVVQLQIKDFPEKPTEEQLQRARRHLRLDERGVGVGVGALRVARVVLQDPGEYLVHAPELLQALA